MVTCAIATFSEHEDNELTRPYEVLPARNSADPARAQVAVGLQFAENTYADIGADQDVLSRNSALEETQQSQAMLTCAQGINDNRLKAPSLGINCAPFQVRALSSRPDDRRESKNELYLEVRPEPLSPRVIL